MRSPTSTRFKKYAREHKRMVALDKVNWNRNYVNIDVYLYEIPRQRPSGLHLHHAEVAQDTHRGIVYARGHN